MRRFGRAPRNPYLDGRRPPVSCIARSLDVDELDVVSAPSGVPVREGAGSPWKVVREDLVLGDHSFRHDDASPLAVRLLGFGGTGLVRPRSPDRDVPTILERGQAWPGASAEIHPGRVSSCHGNSSLLWAARQDDTVLATGYALSEDGLWRQHSWCVAVAGEPAAMETTEPRLLYFGFAMTVEESLDFAACNCDVVPVLAPAVGTAAATRGPRQ